MRCRTAPVAGVSGRPAAPARIKRRLTLYVHLTDSAITGPRSCERCGGELEVARVASMGNTLITADRVRQWAGHPDTRITVKPVIDLADHIRTDAYEIPDRIKERVALRDGACVFPWRTRPARTQAVHAHDADCDHISPWRGDGDTGHTCTCNLAAPARPPSTVIAPVTDHDDPAPHPFPLGTGHRHARELGLSGDRRLIPCQNPPVTSPADWLSGARPRTLPAAVAPVLAGTAVAAYDGHAVWWKALLALLVSTALQVGVNYANDYSDGVRGTDDERTGPMRLVGSGAASPQAVKTAAFVAFGIAALCGLVLAATTAWWLVALGAVSIVAAWFYTGGSRPYGYLGLGEVMVFVFFGLVAVMGTAYVQTERWQWPALYAGVGIGALACAILVANNLRDIPSDTEAGKRTLAVRMGDERTRGLYVLLLLAAAAAVVAIAAATTWSVIIGLGFLAIGVRPVRTVLGGATGPGLIPVLQQTGMAQLSWAVLVSVGLLV